MTRPRHLAPILSGALLTACSVVGIRDGTETPKYQVTDHVGAVEIRQYAARVAAETTVRDGEVAARSDGFRRLAGYIFGGNGARQSTAMTAPVAQGAGQRGAGQGEAGQGEAGQSIAMTAPVAQTEAPDGAWTIQFFMPATYTLEALPKPNDARVRLVEVPAQAYAVLRFTGSTGAPAVAAQGAALLRAVAGSPWRPTGPVVAWFYDPPWTLPFLRRNEVAVPVARAGP